jgi:hypothetical protein
VLKAAMAKRASGKRSPTIEKATREPQHAVKLKPVVRTRDVGTSTQDLLEVDTQVMLEVAPAAASEPTLFDQLVEHVTKLLDAKPSLKSNDDGKRLAHLLGDPSPSSTRAAHRARYLDDDQPPDTSSAPPKEAAPSAKYGSPASVMCDPSFAAEPEEAERSPTLAPTKDVQSWSKGSWKLDAPAAAAAATPVPSVASSPPSSAAPSSTSAPRTSAGTARSDAAQVGDTVCRVLAERQAHERCKILKLQGMRTRVQYDGDTKWIEPKDIMHDVAPPAREDARDSRGNASHAHDIEVS